LKEGHFYGLSVENARKVVPFLRKGGDEAIDAINKLKLDKSGKLSSKALEKLIPSKEDQVDGDGDGDGGDAVVEDGTSKSAYDRAIILLTSIQSLMKEMTGDEADAVRQLAVEFILD
jgi:hypothetical protein